MRHFKLLTFCLFIAGLSGIILGSEPVLCIDGNIKTADVCEPVPCLDTGESVFIGIKICNVLKIHSYSVQIQYDKNKLRFCESTKSISWKTPPFIESNRGHLAAFLTIPEENGIEIAATLAGADSNTTASGDGYLCILKFIVVSSGDPGLKITGAHILDVYGNTINITVDENKECK
jgi:hypothetical protein